MALKHWTVPIVLGVIIFVLGTLVLVLPGKAPTREGVGGLEPAVRPAIAGIPGLLEVATPKPGELAVSPLRLSGRARGTWYFEASFPVRILDANGNELGVVPAQAMEEWMTEEFVPFAALLDFKVSPTATGTLVFEKDNPSGLPEHDRKFEMPVRFR